MTDTYTTPSHFDTTLVICGINKDGLYKDTQDNDVLVCCNSQLVSEYKDGATSKSVVYGYIVNADKSHTPIFSAIFKVRAPKSCCYAIPSTSWWLNTSGINEINHPTNRSHNMNKQATYTQTKSIIFSCGVSVFLLITGILITILTQQSMNYINIVHGIHPYIANCITALLLIICVELVILNHQHN